jgi:hypothetical protein
MKFKEAFVKMNDKEVFKQIAEALSGLSELFLKLAEDITVQQNNEVSDKEYTTDDIRVVMAKLLNAGKKDVVKSILRKYGVEKVSALTPENYKNVIEDAEAEL